MRSAKKRVGLLGGTFDPPHVGHLIAAANARCELQLDVVLVMTANVPWQKAGLQTVSDAHHRLAMVRLTIEGVGGLEASTLEVERQGDTYTADTLEALAVRYPASDVFVIVGSDVAALLSTWKRPEVVQAQSTIVVYDRPGSVGAAPPEGWRYTRIDVPQFAVSSTDIRERRRRDRPIEGMVVPAVGRYIIEHGLYAPGDQGQATR